MDGTSGNPLLSKMRAVHNELDETILELKRSIASAQAQCGSERAEFRVKITDFASIAPVIDSIFSLENIR